MSSQPRQGRAVNLFRLIAPRRIDERFLLFLLPLFFVFSVLLVVITPRQQLRSGLALAGRAAGALGELSAYSLGPALDRNDPNGVREVLMTARQNKDLVYFVVLDARGKIVTAYAVEGNPPQDAKALGAEGPSANGMVYRTERPIVFQGRRLGRLFLGMSLEDVRQSVRASRAELILIGLGVFLLGSILIIRLSRRLTRSLREVTDTAARIAEGDLSLRAPDTSPDEVGLLGRSFNLMVEHLEQASRTLEERVEARTAELRDEVSERRKAEEALRTRELLFRGMMERLSEGVAISDLEEKFAYANPALHEIFGVPPGGLVGRDVREFAQPGQAEVIDLQSRERRRGQRGSYELGIIRGDGLPRSVLVSVMPMRDEFGTVISYLAVVSDITARKSDEERVRQANEMLRVTVKQLATRNEEMNLLSELYDSFQACREESDIYYFAGRYGERLFPRAYGGLYILNASKNLLDLVARWGTDVPGPDVMALEDCWALRTGKPHHRPTVSSGPACPHVAAAGPGLTPTLCLPLTSKEGVIGLLHLGASTADSAAAAANPDELRSQERLATNFVERVTLALVNLRLGEKLKQQSIRDPLTGLFNRRYLEETLEREIYRSVRDQTAVGVMMIDIDHFKLFNDDFGHEAGDFMLRTVSEFLQKQVRREDVVCRYGGEEFAIVLPTADAGITKARAERIIRGVRELKVYHGAKPLGPVTLSIGVSCFPNEGQTGIVLLASADAALYRAKRGGRNRVVYGASCFSDEDESD